MAPVIRIAELDVDPAQLERYKSLLREQIETSVANEPGVLFLYAVSISGSPNQIRILEGYADEAAYEAHLQTPHFLKYKMKTAHMVLSLQLLPTDAVALHGKGSLQLP